VLLSLHRNVVALVQGAEKAVLDFNSSSATEGYTAGGFLQTPRIGGEYVVTEITDRLFDYLDGLDLDHEQEIILLPEDFDFEAFVDEWRDDSLNIRWASGTCAYRCGPRAIDAVVSDKHSDIELYTMDLRPIFDALGKDFHCASLSTPDE
jgi:hypothetical protein